MWEAKYDADYKRGTALIVESNRLDKSALQARKMLELAQRDGACLWPHTLQHTRARACTHTHTHTHTHT
eukprot:COSAG03_NODE_11368_length_596_cov_3.193159_2_plen_68_part_01